MTTVARLTAAALDAPAAPPRELLAGHLALHFAELFTPAEREAWTRGVYAARGAWVADFDAQQFTLGLAWYTHLEQGKTREYFAGAAAANERVERFAPGLQERLRVIASALVGAPVHLRRGWCGAGVHVFPPGAEVARLGGSVHYDLEGLTPAILAAGAPALSLVGMLQPPEQGGGLRLWDRRYAGEESEPHPDPAARADGDAAAGSAAAAPAAPAPPVRHDVPLATLPPPAATVAYDAGDLVVFDSYRLHQIEPFEGARDRVSVTAHLAQAGWGWEIWF